MPWQDRVTDGAYTPPGGSRLVFQFEDVSQSITLRGTAFDFPDADGTYIQRTGNSGRRYPLRCYFTGDDHDEEAAAFMGALEAPGVGLLEHPFYGELDALPFGEVSRRDDLKTAANQTIIDVTFWDTIDIAYPSGATGPGDAVLSAVAQFNDQAADEFAGVVDLDNARDQAGFINRYRGFIAATKSGLDSVADATEAVQDQFDAIESSLNIGVDVLVRQPLTLAAQTLQLVQSPARAAAAIGARLNAYGDLARDIVAQGVATVGLDAGPSNDFHAADLFASSYVSGMVLSVVNNEFETRGEALTAAESILEVMATVTDWRDSNYASLEQQDTGGQYQQLQEAVALATGFLVDISFTLKQERAIYLTRKRTPIDLCAELYGEVDERLQFFIDSNRLSWQEHLEIAEGRRIVYYV